MNRWVMGIRMLWHPWSQGRNLLVMYAANTQVNQILKEQTFLLSNQLTAGYWKEVKQLLVVNINLNKDQCIEVRLSSLPQKRSWTPSPLLMLMKLLTHIHTSHTGAIVCSYQASVAVPARKLCWVFLVAHPSCVQCSVANALLRMGYEVAPPHTEDHLPPEGEWMHMGFMWDEYGCLLPSGVSTRIPTPHQE